LCLRKTGASTESRLFLAANFAAGISTQKLSHEEVLATGKKPPPISRGYCRQDCRSNRALGENQRLRALNTLAADTARSFFTAAVAA
jgi:hypothetical protein